MSVINKLFTAVKGGARELGDAVVDANGVRIFEQEIVDAQNNIRKAKNSLTEVMANKMQAERKIKSLDGTIKEHEGYAKRALALKDEALAMDVAEKIANYETERSEQQGIVVRLEGQITQLKDNIKKAEKLIAEHERELSVVKTTDRVQKATEQVVENIAYNHSTLNSARDSIDRIKKRQQMKQDQLEAGDVLDKEFSDTNLDTKLEDAGIKGGKVEATAVLERLKASQ